MKTKKTALFLIITLTFFPFIAQSSEYKIILQQVIDIKDSGDWVDAEPAYTTWETIDGTRSCKSWEPVIDEQTSDFEQSRDCTVEQTRDKTTREYNTILDEYRDISTTEQQRDYTLPDPETRSIDVATSSWSDSGSVYECSDWTPDTGTAFENETVNQSRNCQQDKQRTVDYTTNGETLDTVTQTQTVSVEETQSVSGTKTMYASCKAINDNGAGNGDGLYTIFPNNNDGVEVYCDMTTEGVGWTLVAAQFEQDPTTWNEGIQNDYDPTLSNGKSFTLNQSQLPAHQQTSFGKSLDVDAMDYFNYQYTTGNINKTTITGQKSLKDYHIHRQDSEYYGSHDPEGNLNQETNPEWRQTLTVDALGGKKRSWAFSANQVNDPASAGYALNGDDFQDSFEDFAWTVWVR